ncbi:multidrug/biocide efflux PACE transporter [Pseudomonas syringae]|nr:multidrug/biocide efflux PACE transporter [Pseudomonas syringae]MBD8576764.1 multidrug/biocide efflux PACE transporter [Pseudomonas syringae]MBD8793421.1 multidrug/biocide efflux PACE transporter [Pseudomonas syringae]MBD8803148.1 multidrug/biocide efflux PACE transporter [Pseudomonas syringae]MBD8813858.1 multidrug/biocide efflux PACE transporter [Pseudomonas syringae]
MTSSQPALPAKTLKERVVHALLFETLGVLICAPLLAWLLDYSLGTMGALTIMISTVAMLWNMLFNTLFDRLRRRLRFEMTFGARVLHALGFEGGLILVVVPMVAWWLSISLWQAFWLDIGVLLFFLPYTMAFNWGYDVLRERVMRDKPATANGACNN